MRKITEDWNNQFPELGVFKPMWLLRRTGPLVSGICLEKDSGNNAYRPTLHVHCLGKPSLTVSLTLASPLLTVKTGVADVIKAAFHQERFLEAAERLRKQASFPLAGSVCLDDCLKAYREYMHRPFGRYPLELFEDIVILFLWCNKRTNAESALRDFAETVGNWPRNAQPDNGIAAWKSQCRNWIDDPNQIRACVATEIQTLKLEAVPYSDLQY